MEHVWILPIFVYSVCTLVVGSAYKLSTHSGTWAFMAGNCTLAIPKVWYTEDGYTVPPGPGITLNGGEKVWVGYTQNYEVLSYIGVGSTHYVSTYNGTWADMAANCTLAIPEILYTVNGNLIQLGPDITIPEGEKVWVGYTQDYEVLRYIGCVPFDQVKDEPHVTKKNDISQCFSACTATEYFGIMNSGQNMTTCWCINRVRNEEVKSCNVSKLDEDFAFGGRSLVSLYSRVPSTINNRLKNVTSWANETTNCLSFFVPFQNEFKWEPCNTSYAFRCTKNLDENTTTYAQWKEAADKCLETHHNLLWYHENITSSITTQLWMAQIKARVISHKTDTAIESNLRRYGYIKRTNDALILEFDRGSNTLQALCSKDYIQSDKEISNKVGIYVGVTLGIFLVVAAIVVAVVILKKRHRPATPSEVNNSKGNPAYEQSESKNVVANVEDNGDVYHEIDLNESTNEDYDIIKDGVVVDLVNQNNNSSNQYFILEKRPINQADETVNASTNGNLFAKETDPTVSKTTVTNVAPNMQSGASGNDYDFAKDTDATSSERPKGNTEYEYATDTRQKTKGKQYAALEQSAGAEHIYNKAGNTTMVHNDYDHIERGRVGADNAAGDNPYDTTSQVKIQRDPTYDHAFV